jgi:hypothetical protein
MAPKDRRPDGIRNGERPPRKAGIVVRSGQRILVVDGLTETTEVLKAVFEPLGHSVHRVRQAQLAATDSPRPNVVVWHADASADGCLRSRFADVPQIVIGKARLNSAAAGTPHFAQPFHYIELLRAIECALQTNAVSA